MKKMFCTILAGAFINLQAISQISNLLQDNNSISIHYEIDPALKNVFISAKASSEQDLIYGINYNYGNALKFNIYSPLTYYISLTAYSSSYTPASSSIPLRMADINNYIYYKVVENSTGGQCVVVNNIRGDVLGKTTRTIITNCIANLIPGNTNCIPAGFGLAFKVYPGYSLPPGNYTTQIMITATYQ
jgi:hypothetical protein